MEFLGCFVLGQKRGKKVLFVLGVSLSVCFECSPTYIIGEETKSECAIVP